MSEEAIRSVCGPKLLVRVLHLLSHYFGTEFQHGLYGYHIFSIKRRVPNKRRVFKLELKIGLSGISLRHNKL